MELAERGKERTDRSLRGKERGSKWLGAKIADWQDCGSEVGHLGVCGWVLRGFLANQRAAVTGCFPYLVRLYAKILIH